MKLNRKTMRDREQELKKRLEYPYKWGGKQKRALDHITDFIYEIPRFDDLLEKIRACFSDRSDHDFLFNYTLNRWFNFWSAKAVEEIFCSLPRVTPEPNPKDRLADFSIDGIRFDHKTSRFPYSYDHGMEYAKSNERDIIEWLYVNQSTEGRHHYGNRLFLITYSESMEHWALKAEILWFHDLIREYVQNFQSSRLQAFEFEPGKTTFSDIIWAIR